MGPQQGARVLRKTMASCEPDPQIEDCPLEALVDDEVPGPPDEGPEGAGDS